CCGAVENRYSLLAGDRPAARQKIKNRLVSRAAQAFGGEKIQRRERHPTAPAGRRNLIPAAHTRRNAPAPDVVDERVWEAKRIVFWCVVCHDCIFTRSMGFLIASSI